jgi:hypothetical protein
MTAIVWQQDFQVNLRCVAEEAKKGPDGGIVGATGVPGRCGVCIEAFEINNEFP